MELDKIQIGERLRKERENKFSESRPKFAERCGLSENHLGKLERGELAISIRTLNKICSATGINADYLLYGNNSNKNSKVRSNIDYYLDRASKEELNAYFKIISTFKDFEYTIKKAHS